VERWGAEPGRSALQVQVLALLDSLRARLRPDVGLTTFSDRVLGGYYVPFRSPSFSALMSPAKSLEFALELWGVILREWTPPVLVTIDRLGFSGVQRILTRHLSMQITQERAFPTGWGHCSADVVKLESGFRPTTTLIRLPHLSTYKLFSREECQPRLRDLFDYAIGS
jgi:hypothetical protein